MKRIIIYYSLTDNTKNAAEILAKLLNADVCRIETVKPMPSNKAKQMIIGGMKAVFGMCPEIKSVPLNIHSYDEIIVGTPVWAGKNVPAVNTLLRNKIIREKVTDIFTLSGGGDNDKCVARLQKMLPNLKHTAAKVYDEVINNTIPYYQEFYNQTLDIVEQYSSGNMKWLDLGCGTGKSKIK